MEYKLVMLETPLVKDLTQLETEVNRLVNSAVEAHRATGYAPGGVEIVERLGEVSPNVGNIYRIALHLLKQ